MSRRVMLALGAGLALLLLILIGVHWVRPRAASGPRVVVAGGDAGGLPRAQPLEERIDAAALERAARDPAANGLRLFIVMRDGHIVFERYAGGLTGESMIDSGPMARVLLALTAGVAAKDGALEGTALQGFDAAGLRAAIEAGSQQHYDVYLSRKIWRRLNAAAAWIALSQKGAAAPADCCFHARALDWMRVANLLVDDGHFEGTQILPPGWLQRMQRPLTPSSLQGFGIELAAAAHGSEPFAAGGVFFVRGNGRWRLWLIPQLKLAVFFGDDAAGAAEPAAAEPAAAAAWDETRLPNLVIRAVSDRPTQPGYATDLQRLVPGH